MHEYYVVKTINTRSVPRQKGYVTESEKKIILVDASYAAAVLKFESEALARTYIKKNSLQKHGCKSFIRTSTDFMADPDYPKTKLEGDWFCLTNRLGEKLCYDSKQGFYWKKCVEKNDFCCGWQTADAAQKIIDQNGWTTQDVSITKVQ